MFGHLTLRLCAFLSYLATCFPTSSISSPYYRSSSAVEFWPHFLHIYGNAPVLRCFLAAWLSIVTCTHTRRLPIPSAQFATGSLLAVLQLQHNLHMVGFRDFNHLPFILSRA